MNPIDEFLMEKRALDLGDVAHSMGGYGTTTATAAAQGFGSGLASSTLAAVGTAAQGVFNAITAKRDFRKMLEWNKDLHDSDQRLLNQSFRTLRRFAPDLSKDPLVAGAMLRSMVESPQGVPGFIQEALSAQKNIPRPIMEAWLKSTQSGAAEGMKGLKFQLPTKPDVRPHVRPGRLSPAEQAAAESAAGAVALPPIGKVDEYGELMHPGRKPRSGFGEYTRRPGQVPEAAHLTPSDVAALHGGLLSGGGLEIAQDSTGKFRRAGRWSPPSPHVEAKGPTRETERGELVTPTGEPTHAFGAGYLRRKV